MQNRKQQNTRLPLKMLGLLRNAIWATVQFFLRVFEKALSCLTKLKKSSCDSVNLTEIGIVSNKDKPADLVTWSSWDDMPIIVTDPGPKPVDSVQLKIDEYRERKMTLQIEPDAEDIIDFFEDMAPNITKQPKILVEEAEECIPETSSVLAVNPNFSSPELGVWEETGKWEDQSDTEWGTFEILRETKKLERVGRMADYQKKKPLKDPIPRRCIGCNRIP